MPANLTPQYMSAEQRFKQASTHEEKIACLEEMLRVMPKHKGTDKLQADLKRRLSKLRQEAQNRGDTPRLHAVGRSRRRRAGRHGGAAQCRQVSTARRAHQSRTGSGRLPLHHTSAYAGHDDASRMCSSSSSICHPSPTSTWNPGCPQITRNADALLLVVDLGDPGVLDAVELITEVLQEWKILPTARPLTAEEQDALDVGVVPRRALLLGNKYDMLASKDNWDILQELYGTRWPTLAVSATHGHNLDSAAVGHSTRCWTLSEYIRKPLAKTGPRPRLSPCHAAAPSLKWQPRCTKILRPTSNSPASGGTEKYDGQMVQRDYVVQEGDVIELHM